MTERVRADLLAALRERLAAKGITADSDFSIYPVAAVCLDSVPYVGNVHLPEGRSLGRVAVDRKLRA